MLIFKREAFVAGTTLVKEPADPKKPEGPFKVYLLGVKDQNKEHAFIDEAYVLAKYASMFKKKA